MKALYAFACSLILTMNASRAQPATTQAEPKAKTAELQKHDLKWIKSSADFDQSKLSKAAVNSEIEKLIKSAIVAKTLNARIEIPINQKELSYLGYMHPNQTMLFDANRINKASKNTPELDTMVHIYKYDDFYISTEADKAVDQQNVYYAVRALNILRTRYPSAYKTMFVDSKTPATQTPKYGQWVNSNKAFWIAFNSNPKYIATNNTIYQGAGYFPNSNNTIGNYSNVSLVNIDSRNILGDLPTIGSRPIYNLPNNWENYHMYMREGLAESIIHEMCHNYLDLAYTYDEKFNKIRAKRNPQTNFASAEENAVLNTSLPYFTRHGGLSNTLSEYYYRATFEPNVQSLQSANLLSDYASVFSDTPITPQNSRQVFLLPILTD